MRVLVMLSGIAMGGAERNIVSVVPHLKVNGVEVMVCTLNKRRDSPLAEVFSQTGIERFDLNARRMTDLAAWKRFTALLREKKIDILHVEDQDTIVYGGLARRLLQVPCVITRHVMEEPVTSWKTALRARMVFWSARYGVDKVIAVSEVVRRHFAKQAGLPFSKVETIYNGIELEKFHNPGTRNKIRASMGWEANRPIAFFISVLRPGKGFEVLFKAIPKIRSVLPGFRVALIGSGELESELRKQAEPLGDAVEFLGQRMDVPELLSAGDLLIQASWSEALPTVLIEAGAASLPVVATDVGGSAEIVQDGKGGYIIAPGDVEALADRTIELLQSPDRALTFGRHAHEYVTQTFSLEKQAKETIALYERVVAGKS